MFLTTSLEVSFSGVWAGSAAAGLLDGMARSGSVRPSLESKKWSKSKHGKGPQKHQVQLHSICQSVGWLEGRSLVSQSSPSPGSRKRKHTHTALRSKLYCRCVCVCLH